MALKNTGGRSGSSETTGGGGLRLLVVAPRAKEGDEASCALERHGHAAIVALSVPEATQAIATHPIDGVLLAA